MYIILFRKWNNTQKMIFTGWGHQDSTSQPDGDQSENDYDTR